MTRVQGIGLEAVRVVGFSCIDRDEFVDHILKDLSHLLIALVVVLGDFAERHHYRLVNVAILVKGLTLTAGQNLESQIDETELYNFVFVVVGILSETLDKIHGGLQEINLVRSDPT